MSKTKLLIWAIMLAVPGGVGLWTVQSYENLHEQQVHTWRPQVQEVTDHYLESYRKWTALPYDEKAVRPWGHGEFGGEEIQKKLQLDQDKRLTVDISELANGTKSVPPELASLMYGEDWQEKVDDFQHDRRVCEIINILSSACIVVGALLFVTIGIIWLVGTVIRKTKKTEKQSQPQSQPQASQPQPTQKEKESAVEPAAVSPAPIKEATPLSPKKKKDQDGKSSVNSSYFESLRQRSKLSGAGEEKPLVSPVAASPLTPFASAVTDAEPVSMMTPEPVLNSLSELTEEVSAIRQYAAQQQDQMRKLQDGYDWMLIRRFCLRIIRCIDNISDRIERLNSNSESEDSNPHTLEDIRDELIYALESSGIESFSPDIGAAYKGLERYAEAVHDRCHNDDPDRSGTIAKIIRPGYQYLISESEIKVVRCAQVQLYE